MYPRSKLLSREVVAPVSVTADENYFNTEVLASWPKNTGFRHIFTCVRHSCFSGKAETFVTAANSSQWSTFHEPTKCFDDFSFHCHNAPYKTIYTNTFNVDRWCQFCCAYGSMKRIGLTFQILGHQVLADTVARSEGESVHKQAEDAVSRIALTNQDEGSGLDSKMTWTKLVEMHQIAWINLNVTRTTGELLDQDPTKCW